MCLCVTGVPSGDRRGRRPAEVTPVSARLVDQNHNEWAGKLVCSFYTRPTSSSPYPHNVESPSWYKPPYPILPPPGTNPHTLYYPSWYKPPFPILPSPGTNPHILYYPLLVQTPISYTTPSWYKPPYPILPPPGTNPHILYYPLLVQAPISYTT